MATISGLRRRAGFCHNHSRGVGLPPQHRSPGEPLVMPVFPDDDPAEPEGDDAEEAAEETSESDDAGDTPAEPESA